METMVESPWAVILDTSFIVGSNFIDDTPHYVESFMKAM